LPIRILALVFFCGIAIGFAQEQPPAPTPSVVYSVRDPAAIEKYRTNPAVVRRMVNRLVLSVTGQADVARAWRSLVSPADKIGIKISAAGGELFTTRRDVVDAIVEGLVAAGHPRESIIVWDRHLEGIKRAGYRAEGYQLMSIEPRTGYDEKAVFSGALMGTLIWGDLRYIPRFGENPLATDTENTSSVSHFARILSSRVTKIINVPVMSDCGTTGIAGCLHNVTLPNIDNWRRFTQYGRVGAGGIAELYADPMIRGKVVLNIMDGLLAAYAGGPEAHPNYAVHHATLLASRDAVAVDAVALRTLEQLRATRNFAPIGDRAAHVEIAGQLGLGNADAARIQVRELGR
jgi:hypothetical protein